MAYQLELSDYLRHLYTIKTRLKDFIISYNEGKHEYIEDISLKLRILYVPKSGTDPLFESVFRLLNIKFLVWVRETRADELNRKGLNHLLTQEAFSFVNEVDYWLDGGTEQIDLLCALCHQKVIKINNDEADLKRLISLFADKLGGAHFDRNIPSDVLNIFSNSIKFGEDSLAIYMILLTAKKTIQIIDMILEFSNSKKYNRLIRPL
jgi:hypothetical protein